MRLVMWDVDRTLLSAGPATFDAYVAAFTEVTGREWAATVNASGRTDLWITDHVLAQHGIPDAGPHVAPLLARYAANVADRRAQLAEQAVALPGVDAVMATLASRPDITQTLVTGNIAAVAAAKVAAVGLDRYLEAAIGGYGDEHRDRAELVRLSRARAEAAHGPFADCDVLVVGDTAHDVAAALACGATAVAVATGRTGVDELADAGAHHVFTDLADVEAVIAVLAP